MYIKTMQLVFYLTTFSTPCMGYLLYLMFRCDGDVMESLDFGGVLWDLNTPCVDVAVIIPETQKLTKGQPKIIWAK